MRHSSESHNVARLRVFLNRTEKFEQQQFADLIGCSVHTLQSIEVNRLKLSEDLARKISRETGVHSRWLLDNDLEADIVRSPDGRPYSKSDYECAQANNRIGSTEFVRHMAGDYAASFYGQIRAILSSAAKRNLAEIATWRIAKFLDDCRREFGHDKQLIESKEQFGLRADDSPYLKFRQINAGIDLFRKYDRDRKRSIAHDLAMLKKAKQKKKPRSKRSSRKLATRWQRNFET